MKIKRFVDIDMRQVLGRVRQDQGPDAVILSTRRVDGGIEVIAAVDYDEALMRHALGPVPEEEPAATRIAGVAGTAETADTAGSAHRAGPVEASMPAPERPQTVPATAARRAGGDLPETAVTAPERVAAEEAEPAAEGPALAGMRSELSSLRGLLETQLSGLLWKNNARRSPLRAQVLRNLARIGLAPDIAAVLVNGLEPIEDLKDIWRDPLRNLARAIPVTDDGLLTEGGIVALIGPTGVGKTTTLAKLAARYVMRNGADDIALVCADAWRIGARQQLDALGSIIGVRVHAASDARELNGVLDTLRAKKLVLIDTEGLSQRDLDLSARLAAYRDSAERIRFYLTLSAASQEAGLDETVRQFGCLPLSGAVVTKIDEAAQLGCVIGTLIRHGLPAAWLTDGQRVPDDLYSAAKKKLWLVNQAVQCMESSEPRIDERTMAENYGPASAAHA